MRPGLRWRLADLGRAFKDALFASPEGAQPMEPLRGTARRVIVVPSPDPRVFEQAVFIVSDDYLHTPGKSPTELLRRARKQLPEAAPQLPATRHAEHQIVDQLVQFVSANAGRRLSLQELADAAHISLPYMHRLFQTHLGLAPGQYIAKIRMEEAKTLLRSGSLSMGAVAREMGFSSQQHFSRQFRSVCGMTPSEYVRSLR